jgi:hypothetical protein
MNILKLKDENFIAKGNERACYLHPKDCNKAIKVSYNQDIGKNKQTKIEINYYKDLLKKTDMDYTHLPKYYGEIKTDKGDGFIVELIRDYDNKVSKSFAYYLNRDGLDKYQDEIEEYRNYLLKNHIVFNYGMMPKNILLRKVSESKAQLVLIDGLGDVAYFTFTNKIPFFVERKIKRRWEKFRKKYLNKNIKNWRE